MNFHEFEPGAHEVRHDGRVLEAGGVVKGYWSHADHLILFTELVSNAVVDIYDAGSLTRSHRIEAPEGWDFYRLARWGDDQPSVVAITDNLINGHGDWHWLIDIEHGTIKRVSPAR